MAPLEYIMYTASILAVVCIDQLSKILVVTFLKPIVDLPILNGVFHLHYHINYGAIGGLWADKRYLFMTVSTVMIIAVTVYLFCGMAENHHIGISLAMIAGGGIGNMIDRIFPVYTNNSIFNCGVVDFIYFKLIDYPIFNIADSFVCIGTFSLATFLIISIIKEEKAKKAVAGAKEAADTTPEEEKKSENGDEI